MNCNDHAYVSTERLSEAPRPDNGGVEEQLNFGFDALTQASLALAFEQRTANLIDMAAICAANGRRELGEPYLAEANTRLGLNGDTK